MSEAFDRNVAIERYSSSSGNHLDLLLAYCKEAGYGGDPRVLASEIDQVQGAIWGIVLGTRGKSSFSKQELEHITRDYVMRTASWVDRIGIAALTQWVISMARREGYLQSEDNHSDA